MFDNGNDLGDQGPISELEGKSRTARMGKSAKKTRKEDGRTSPSEYMVSSLILGPFLQKI